MAEMLASDANTDLFMAEDMQAGITSLDRAHGGWPPRRIRSMSPAFDPSTGGSTVSLPWDSNRARGNAERRSGKPLTPLFLKPSAAAALSPSGSANPAVQLSSLAGELAAASVAAAADPTPAPYQPYGFDTLSYPWDFGGTAAAGNRFNHKFSRGGGRIRLIGLVSVSESASESEPILDSIQVNGRIIANGESVGKINGEGGLGGGAGGSVVVSGPRVSITSHQDEANLQAAGGNSLFECGGGGGIVTVMALTGLFVPDTGVTSTSGGVTLYV